MTNGDTPENDDKNVVFWADDITVLTKYWWEIIPYSHMTNQQKGNALTRLTIIVAIGLFVSKCGLSCHDSSMTILIALFAIIIILMFYCKRNEDKNNSDESGETAGDDGDDGDAINTSLEFSMNSPSEVDLETSIDEDFEKNDDIPEINTDEQPISRIVDSNVRSINYQLNRFAKPDLNQDHARDFIYGKGSERGRVNHIIDSGKSPTIPSAAFTKKTKSKRLKFSKFGKRN